MTKSKKRVVVLSAKTGGGHRAAALAIVEQLENDPSLEVIHFDFLEAQPRPIRDIPKMYSAITKLKSAYGTIFKLTEGSRQAQFALDTIAKRYQKEIRQIITELDPDIMVSCHFGANTFLPLLQNWKKHVPFITVVTDLATGHPMWFDKRADLIIVPSSESYKRARSFGVPTDKLKLIGLPTASAFNAVHQDKSSLKAQLDWPADIPSLLVMAGGDGMGKVSSLTRQLDKISANVHIAVIAGRNQSLQNSLQARKTNNPTTIYGFCDNVAELMHASDLLLTKAGPGTIVEAIISRLPIVLYDFLPGQEEGNLHYVVDNRAGLWASTNNLAVRATEDLLAGHIKVGGPRYEKIRLQHSRAAQEIAKLVSTY
ncbi:hypothetical protein H0W80_02245 [Candidatus Saccharibacteria bacterium]|nr:hypothetical protein [Candidatus Saccharibacteria bacterium]